MDNEVPPSASAQGSARRRSPRIRSDDPYELPDTSKESDAQDNPAEVVEVEEQIDDAEETEVEPESEAEPELPSPEQSIEAPEENEAEIELPVLPNGNASTSPDAQPSSGRTEENDPSPDAPQNIPIDTLSSITRLHTTLAEEDDVPASSSPLVSKLRRSGGHSMSRSRISQGRASRATEVSQDADELEPERPDQAPADDELLDDNQIEDEPADITMEPAEEEPEEIEEPEEPEEEGNTQEEEEAVAEAISAVEAAKTIGRKRPRRSLQPQSPEAEPEEQVEEEPASKRRRGQSSRSPATQKQPAAKPLPKQVRRTKQAEKARRISDGSAIEITVQRFVNVKKYGEDDGEEDQLAGDVPFIMNGETVVDVFSHLCFEVIDGVVAKLYDTLGNTDEKEKKKECRIKILALEAYKEELTSRLLQQVRYSAPGLAI